jgi:VanZ family protein
MLQTEWIPRTGLGWEYEHFIVYFATRIILSSASRRSYVVAIALVIFAGILRPAKV